MGTILNQIRRVRQHRKNYMIATKQFISESKKRPLKPMYSTCCKRARDYIKLYIAAVFHDLSAYLPSECICAADYRNDDIYGKLHGGRIDYVYKMTIWRMHYRRNKHHPEYWMIDWDEYYREPCVGIVDCLKNGTIIIPPFYIRCMIIDWMAECMDTADNVGCVQELYLNRHFHYYFDPIVRYIIEIEIGLLNTGELSEYSCMSIDSISEYIEMNKLDLTLNDILRIPAEKYDIDIDLLYKMSRDDFIKGKPTDYIPYIFL